MSKRIKLFCCDIDGTITNGNMTFDHAGNVSKSYHTRDVTALWLLQNAGIQVLMLTGSNHTCDCHRFAFLNAKGNFEAKAVDEPIERFRFDTLIQAKHNKLEALTEQLELRGIQWNEVAYIGDADNDRECLEKVGWSACPSDAEDHIKNCCAFVSSKRGGQLAVKEFADQVIATNISIRSSR